MTIQRLINHKIYVETKIGLEISKKYNKKLNNLVFNSDLTLELDFEDGSQIFTTVKDLSDEIGSFH